MTMTVQRKLYREGARRKRVGKRKSPVPHSRTLASGKRVNVRSTGSRVKVSR